MKQERYPRLTPLRSLALLLEMTEMKDSSDVHRLRWAVTRAANALDAHVKAHIVARRRRAAKRKGER